LNLRHLSRAHAEAAWETKNEDLINFLIQEGFDLLSDLHFQLQMLQREYRDAFVIAGGNLSDPRIMELSRKIAEIQFDISVMDEETERHIEDLLLEDGEYSYEVDEGDSEEMGEDQGGEVENEM